MDPENDPAPPYSMECVAVCAAGMIALVLVAMLALALQ
jgi:hypothetical protein